MLEDRPALLSNTAQGQVIASSFRAHPLLRGAHAQTIVPSLLRKLPALDLQLEILDLPDGDFVRVGWCGERRRPSRIAVLVHGLTGGFESKYLRGLAQQLIQRQWCVAILELRGAGALPNRSAHTYHHGDTGDLRYLWQRLREREPQARLAAVGWSLGANVLLKALGEDGAAAPVAAAAAVSAPFLIEPCAEKLRRGFSRVYQQRLLRDLQQLVLRKQAAVRLPASVDVDAAVRARDFFEFDDAYTAPLHGFADARDYYTRCSSQAFLQRIARPTLIINALDDPFMVPEVLPRAEQLAPSVTLELATHGGHVGFAAADARGGLHWWLETRIADWLNASVPASAECRP
jgi:predicted alpha/beta-fold hydrolase